MYALLEPFYTCAYFVIVPDMRYCNLSRDNFLHFYFVLCYDLLSKHLRGNQSTEAGGTDASQSRLENITYHEFTVYRVLMPASA